MIYFGNFKMNIPNKEYISQLDKNDSDNIIGLALPYVYIDRFSNEIKGKNILLGAQNCSDTDTQAMTGEISPEMLCDVGTQFVIVGHSERRKHYNETGAKINSKIKKAVDCGLKVVLCVGETLEDYERKNTMKVIEKQLKDCLKGLTNLNSENLIVAYEPVWAIGTGLMPANMEIEAIIRQIKSITQVLTKNEIKVLYGGSCKPNNIVSLKECEGIDGFLIGGACLDIDSLKMIINS